MRHLYLVKEGTVNVIVLLAYHLPYFGVVFIVLLIKIHRSQDGNYEYIIIKNNYLCCKYSFLNKYEDKKSSILSTLSQSPMHLTAEMESNYFLKM